jgi:uncharacterized protein
MPVISSTIQTAILLEFRFQVSMGLIIRSSAIHAAGCYTTSPIAKGSRVVEYTGPIIEKDEADRRYCGKEITYLFAVGDGTRVIDGHGMAMFINHSCDANCETEEIDGQIWICAIRNIRADEEISYDYSLFDGDEQDAPCNCGAKNCRGSMFSPEELKRRRRTAAKAAVRQGVAQTKALSANGNGHHGHVSNGAGNRSHVANSGSTNGRKHASNGSGDTHRRSSAKSLSKNQV